MDRNIKKILSKRNHISGNLAAASAGAAGSSLDLDMEVEKRQEDLTQRSLDLDEEASDLKSLEKEGSLNLDDEDDTELDSIHYQRILQQRVEKKGVEKPSDSRRQKSRPVPRERTPKSKWSTLFKRRVSLGSPAVAKAVFEAGVLVGSPMDYSKDLSVAEAGSAAPPNNAAESRKASLPMHKDGFGSNFGADSHVIEPVSSSRVDVHPAQPSPSAMVTDFWAAYFPAARAQQLARKTAQLGVRDEGGLDCLCYEELVSDEDIAADFGLWGDEVRYASCVLRNCEGSLLPYKRCHP